VKGTIVGSYRILGTISVGGMGTVYRAEHTLIGRLAAIKILHPELCANRSIVNRFFNEAKTTSSIKHPGIVEVFDFGYMPSGHAYLIMEFLEGAPLSHRIRARGKMPEGEAAVLLRGVCIALSAAHDRSVVHRDLKPDNIIVMPDTDSPTGERVKLLDFGIAKLTDIGLNGSATRTGSVMGTPTYMSPEQCRGSGDVDSRADLYSIGCIYYEMVAGRPPFVRSGAGEAIGSHLFVDPDPPSRHVAGLSADTEALIMKLLAKKPEQRVQTARDLAHLLAGIAQQRGWLTAGDLSRPSLNQASEAIAPARVDSATAMPATQLPTSVVPPGGAPTPSPTSTVEQTLKRTTLSGAASEVTEPPTRSRNVLRLAIAGILAMAAGGVGAVLAFSGGSGGDGESAAAALPREPDPVTAPSPAAVPPAAAPPTTTAAAQLPAASSAAAATSAPSSGLTPPPVPPAAKPAAGLATTSASGAPSAAPTPAARPAAIAPSVTPAAKPVKKPARKSEKTAGSASDNKDLLEQDI
jgi:serine/threonine protein kinase